MDYEEIAAEINGLNRPEWLKIVTRIHNNFKGCPFDYDDQEPLNAIGAILKSLKADPRYLRTMDDYFKNHLSKLDCFTYRSYYIDPESNQAVYWNPIEMPFSQFKSPETIEYQADIEYPPSDIIRTWFYLQTHECKN